MKLKAFRTIHPIVLEGEDGSTPQTFIVGGQCGVGVVYEVEATPVGVVVRREWPPGVSREGGPTDMIVVGQGSGILLEKQRREPAQLKGAR
jgi:hypothetical protein